MNAAIAGDSVTGQKKFTAWKWAWMIGFCGFETQKQVQNNWKQIEKAHDATDVCTIVVTAIKGKKVDIDRQSSRVWFGEDDA